MTTVTAASTRHQPPSDTGPDDDPISGLVDELTATITRLQSPTGHALLDTVDVIGRLTAAGATARRHRDRAKILTAIAALTSTSVARDELTRLVDLAGFTGTWRFMVAVLTSPADMAIHRIDPAGYLADLIRGCDPANRAIWFAVIDAELGCSTWNEPDRSQRSSREIHDDHLISIRRHELRLTAELADLLETGLDPDRADVAKQMFAVIANDNGAIRTDLHAAAVAARTLATM